jgi:hypothetical protein
MTRTHLVSMMVLIVAVPAAAAGSFFASSTTTSNAKPCFIAGSAGYQLSEAASANYTVRIDNAAPSPSLRMQMVDDPAAADFVLVDDGDTTDACKTATAIKSVRIDPAALAADLTIALSRAAADYTIYVRSANYTEQDAAALFAVIWQNARKTGQKPGLGREFAERH